MAGWEIDNAYIRARWETLAGMMGADLANFIVCAFADVYYSPRISARDWPSYLSKLKSKAEKRFQDGETDIKSAVLSGLGDKERWEAEWGTGNEENRYTSADYRRLDEIYKTLSARNAGGIDAQQEYTLRNCAQMSLLREKCLWKGDKESIDKAKNLDKMIQDNLAAENLRKKDSGPQQAARLDGIVDALKRKYGYGVELTREQATEACARWLVSHHYNCTKDAAEHAMLSIINAMRTNSDLPMMQELDPEARLDGFEAEFERALSAAGKREKSVYDYLGLRRNQVRAAQQDEAKAETQKDGE